MLLPSPLIVIPPAEKKFLYGNFYFWCNFDKLNLKFEKKKSPPSLLGQDTSRIKDGLILFYFFPWQLQPSQIPIKVKILILNK